MRRMLGGGLILIIGAYGAICLYMWARQDSLVYPGGTVAAQSLPSPESAGLKGFEAVTLDTPDGEHLKAWWHPPEADRGTVLYLQGNAGNLAAPWRVERLQEMAAYGLGVFGLEYRGFGGSSGHPSEPGLIADAETAYDFIARKAPDTKIALFGDSLGTGVAVALATRRPVAGLLLDSPFASALRLGQSRYPWLPVAWLMRSSWESESRIAPLAVPVLIAHCDADRTVPVEEGKRLFQTISTNRPDNKLVILPDCGHVQTWKGVKIQALTDLAAWTTP